LDLPLLYKEKSFVNHQFPTVAAIDDPPVTYEGMLRCERGEVKKLAEQKIWPFTEYADWNRFRLQLPEEYPLKPPVVTWISEISHPNIVPLIPSAVCVSILGDKWRPDLKLVSVLNALYYLLSDPNPENVFDHPSCLKAAKVCRSYGFPKMVSRRVTPSDTLRFNIIPLPTIRQVRSPGMPRDIVRFRIPGRERRSLFQ
jgi:hypothetical protein